MPKALIWLQDPSVTNVAAGGVKEVLLPNHISAGPRSELLIQKGQSPVKPNADGNFLFDRTKADEQEAFDAVHTFAVAQMVVNLFESRCGRKVRWHWHHAGSAHPLAVVARSVWTVQTQYVRPEREIRFKRPPLRPLPGEKYLFECRSLDVVAHETGHAVLDGLKPTWNLGPLAGQGEKALHEAFGDLTTLFLVLSELDLVTYLVRDRSGKLPPENLLAVIGEEYGKVKNNTAAGIRNLDNRMTLSSASDPYELSLVLSGLVYDGVLARFSEHRTTDGARDVEALFAAGAYMCTLVLKAFRRAPATSPQLTDVINQLVTIAACDGQKSTASYLARQAEKRGVSIL